MRIIKRLFIYGFFITLLIGCAGSEAEQGGSQQNPYPVDALFEDFYYQKNRDEYLGITISPLFTKEQFQFQYTVSGLMVFNPLITGGEKCALMPLGNEMQIPYKISSKNETTNNMSSRAYQVYQEFLPFYEKLGGEGFAGKVLTPPRYNPKVQRFEQYFEKIGFYRLEENTSGNVRLLAYGAWGCGDSCVQLSDLEGKVIESERVDENFIQWISRIGVDFTGFALTNAYKTQDGYVQQVFENVVLRYIPDNKDNVFLLSLPEKLGLLPDTPKLPSNDPTRKFIPIQGEFGFDVPIKFIEYIEQHGDFEISGMPIDEYKAILSDVNRQCFQNICLLEDLRVEGELRIRPASLGLTFAQLPGQVFPTEIGNRNSEFYQSTEEPEGQGSGITAGGEISLQVWELHPWVNPDQQQEIGARIYLNGLPVDNIEPYLTIYLPGSEKITIQMPATGSNGQTGVLLDKIDAPSGTLIPYQVCVRFKDGISYCARGDFLIWYTQE